MTIGSYIDLLVRGMMEVMTPLYAFILGCLSGSIAFERWWFNNYNIRRASIYSRSIVFTCIIYVILGLDAIKPGVDHIVVWRLLGLFVWIVLFIVLGLYFAVILVNKKTWTSAFAKNKLIKILRKQADLLEQSIAQAQNDTNKNNAKIAVEIIKEVVIDNKDVLALL